MTGMEIACFGGLAMCVQARNYGMAIRCGEVEDTFGIQSTFGVAVESMLDRGLLGIYKVNGVTVVGPGGLPMEDGRREFEDGLELECHAALDGRQHETVVVPFQGKGQKLGVDVPFQGKAQKLGALFYKYTIEGSRVHISPEHVPAFLMQNGIDIMNGVQLKKALLSRLSKTMSLTDCQPIAEYSRGRKMGSHPGLDVLSDLKPGDIVMKLHMATDFNVYLADPAKYEDQLKCEILRALHLDPSKLPNAKSSLKILKMEKGSIVAFIAVSVVLLVACAVITASIAAGSGKKKGAGARGRAGANTSGGTGRQASQNAATRPRQSRPQQTAPVPTNVASGTATPAQHARPQQAALAASSVATNTASSSIGGTEAAAHMAPMPSSAQLLSNSTATPPQYADSPLAPSNALSSVSQVVNSTLGAYDSDFQMVDFESLDRVQVSNNSDGSWELIGHLQPQKRCFLRSWVFQVDHYNYREAQALKVGDTILGRSGKTLHVISKVKHDQTLCDLVRLCTQNAELTVSCDHDIDVPNASGGTHLKAAGLLKKDDLVFVGKETQKIVKVRKWQANVELVELCFDPDDPVEARLLPRWAISSMGARPHASRASFGPLGPFHMTENIQPSRANVRARSASM